MLVAAPLSLMPRERGYGQEGRQILVWRMGASPVLGRALTSVSVFYL